MRRRVLVTLILASAVLFCGMLIQRSRLATEMPDPIHLDPLSSQPHERDFQVSPQTRALISQTIEPSAMGYVGSDRCAECHADIAKKFQRHPMSRSMSLVPGEQVIEDYVHNTFFTSEDGREYGVELVDGEVSHFERFRDVNGNVVYEQFESVEFAVGSGQRGRSYLLNRDGLLFMSPVTWYSEGGRWDLSPGYDSQSHPRFERRVADGCIACHAGAVRQERNGPNRFASEPFFEMSIGCERCHGPGNQHIELQHFPYETDQQDSIVNPAKLNSARRNSVCYQCHLHGVNRVPRAGHSEFSFRPGALLSDDWIVFVSNHSSVSKGSSARAVSQVEQMHESACFKGTNGQLGCVSCHDPHSVPLREERVSFFRDRCISCHHDGSQCSLENSIRLESSPEDSCIKCHMPKSAASDVPHTSQTDHRVLKRPEKLGSSKVSPGGAPVPFAQKLFPVTPKEIARAEGIIFAGFSEPMASDLAEEALWRFQQIDTTNQFDVELRNAIGQSQLRVGRLRAAKSSLEQAFNEMPGHEAAIDGLTEASERLGDLELALAWAQRFVEVNPRSTFGHSRLAFLLARLDKPQRAIQSAETALKLNPLMHSTRELLIRLLKMNGQATAAAGHQKILSRLQAIDSKRLPQ